MVVNKLTGEACQPNQKRTQGVSVVVLQYYSSYVAITLSRCILHM